MQDMPIRKFGFQLLKIELELLLELKVFCIKVKLQLDKRIVPWKKSNLLLTAGLDKLFYVGVIVDLKEGVLFVFLGLIESVGDDWDVFQFVDNLVASLCVFDDEDAFLLGEQSQLIEVLFGL